MNIKRTMSSLLLAALTMVSFQASAGNVTATQARVAANNFIKQQVTGHFNATAMSDLKLAHAEASSAVKGTNTYYVFNIKGGGWVIVSGEDRTPQVLGYSDKGQMDFNNLPYNLKGILDGYKSEIEFLQTYTEDDLVPIQHSYQSLKGVDPLVPTTWGQEDPYDWQCPIKNGEYCVVGCVATAMAQVMYYWKFPESCDAISSYYSYGYGNVSALPATTFDYNKMLLSYCHWDWDNSELVQDTYTDDQAQEVAKLGRYCGQAANMQYSPDGSGAYTWDQMDAMETMGFRNTIQDVSKSGWWGGGYTTAEWEALIKTELDAGRPILYSASDPSEGGHAFICDGYNSNNYFHFNLGWYGTCDGWYLTTSLQMVHRSGDQLNFSNGHEMLIGIQPPEGWEPPVTVIRGDVDGNGIVGMDDLTALINYLVTGDATGINLANADCDGVSGVGMDDLTALINYLVYNQW